MRLGSGVFASWPGSKVVAQASPAPKGSFLPVKISRDSVPISVEFVKLLR